ncbi:MAG: hypothetical protein H7Z40_06020 [Phycisphaerae bacterium]|nr:hypothetical protein [Gemmatimonadaceae bacterium]
MSSRSRRAMWQRVRATVRDVSACAVVCVTLLSACDNTARVPADSSSVGAGTPAANDSLRPAVGTGWETGAGPFLVLPTVDGGHDAGSLLRPDATDLTVGDLAGLPANGGGALLELFSRSGSVGESTFSIDKAPALDSGCTAWPTARLASSALAPGAGVVGGAAARGAWTAAFVKGRVNLVPLDSIEGLSSRDSSMLAANISRLASALADDTVATFRGLPFVVLRAYRGSLGEQSFVVTTLVRRINQEDNPREERLVMVIDGEKSAPATWTVGWWERAAGREDELVVSEPLLSFHLPGSTTPQLLFGRDDGEALSAATLVRQGQSWRVQWESALAGCDR